MKSVFWKKLLFIALAISFFAVAQSLADRYIAKKTNNGVVEIEKEIPEIPVTPTSTDNGQGGQEDPHIITLFSPDSPYKPSVDVFNDIEEFRKEAKDLALFGKFSTAEFVIESEPISNNKLNFLSVNIGNLSGVYGVSRTKDNKLVYTNKQVVFNKYNPLDLRIDLISSQTRLSSTKKELESGLDGYKDLYLWQYIVPPPESGTVVKVLFVPFSKDGIVGEVTLNRVEFHYRCEELNGCKAALCDEGQLGSECLETKIEKGASSVYTEFFK